ncbi:cytochrome B561 [Erwinia typographi]|uniref:Cytochrome B561 n=1 Tax=Erwinia typographi TaxID=371042 RepID=A0A0A3ZBK4_9GAMM|nr:cytochrome B561 [Erwinia typographi]
MSHNADAKSAVIHPLWLRLLHWINALAVLMMVTSGWRIYNASPLFDFDFPDKLTLGGWLGGALQWHFAAMWVFGGNGLLYLIMNLVTGRFQQKYWPLSLRALMKDMLDALRGRLLHTELSHYNMVQRMAYLFAIFCGIVLVLSGLVLWKSVQFPLLRDLLGGYETARWVHFLAMSSLMGFLILHIVMVGLVPKTLIAMIRGR